MKSYMLSREIRIVETVIVKAQNKGEATTKAEDDIDCRIVAELEGDYEVDPNSISEVEE